MNNDNETQNDASFEAMLQAAAARVLTDYSTPSAHAQCADGQLPTDLWNALATSGLMEAVGPDGPLEWETLAVMMILSGEFAVPVPWVETLLAQRHLNIAGLAYPDGPLSIAPSSPGFAPPTLSACGAGWQFSGTLSHVSWARHAQAVAILARHPEGMALVRLDRDRIPEGNLTTHKNVADEPRDSLVIHDLAPLVVLDLPASAVSLDYAPANNLVAEGALARSLQMVGAMRKVLEMSLQYSMNRVQFGKPIAKFQAIQHMVAVQASHLAAATGASMAAVHAAQQGPALFEIAATKVRTGEAAGLAARTAHQVHGAMGITQEYPLHLWTRRLFAWRDEFGSESQWAGALGRLVLDSGGPGLWPLICEPSSGHNDLEQHMGTLTV